MNLIDEDYSNNKTNKTSTLIKVIIVLIILIVIAIIGIAIYMAYLDSTTLRVYVDGQESSDVKNLLVFEDDGTIYVPVRSIASYLGYSCYSGEYSDRSQDSSKCYVECDGEAANLTLNSNKIYKLNLEEKDDNYTYVYMDQPVKAIEGELYITTDGMQKAFNTTFYYDQTSNTITIYTTPYLISAYSTTVLDYGYTEISETFENQKAVVQGMLVVTDDKYYGVINASDGTAILECQYDDILYQESTGDFIVCSNNQYGIIGTDQKTKVSIYYDSIELMDYDVGLYLVKRNNQYGVIDLNGNTVIYVENDQIGVDISDFEDNDLKTGYILLDTLIPVKKNNKWGLFDTEGNQLVDFEYDSFGYVASGNGEARNLLVIPSYNVLVACLNDRYTLLDTSGEQPIKAFVDDIYMVISGGEKSYQMSANDKTYDVEEYLERLGVQSTTSNTTSNTTNTTSNTTSNTTANTTQSNTTTDDDETEDQASDETEEIIEETQSSEEE